MREGGEPRGGNLSFHTGETSVFYSVCPRKKAAYDYTHHHAPEVPLYLSQPDQPGAVQPGPGGRRGVDDTARGRFVLWRHLVIVLLRQPPNLKNFRVFKSNGSFFSFPPTCTPSGPPARNASSLPGRKQRQVGAKGRPYEDLPTGRETERRIVFVSSIESKKKPMCRKIVKTVN